MPDTLPDDLHPRLSIFSGLWWLDQLKELLAALSFLSRIPVPGSAHLFATDDPQPRLFLGSAYFPLIGLLLAVLLSLLPFILGSYLSAMILAALLVIASICLTGGLHLDGLMDACDGLFSGRDRERKLEIMRDSRVGSFGVLGGVSVLLLKFSLFASLDPQLLPFALLLVIPIARWNMLLALRCFPSARSGGLGTTFQQTVTPSRLLFAGICSLFIALLIGHILGLLLWLLGSILALAISAWVCRVLGGLTGDIYGAICEVSEVTLLLAFVLVHSLV